MLTIHNLRVDNRLDLNAWTVPTAQFVGVIGANGAGKSTLLSVLAGQLPTAPQVITLAHQDLAQLTVQQRRQYISYLPQFAAVTTAVTVQHVLLQGMVNLTLANGPHAELAKVCHEFDLTALLNRPITQLSGGEQRRVQVARACLGNVQLALFDEPTTGLDIGQQLELMTLLKHKSQSGTLVMAALHDLALAAQFCDQLLLLHQGRLVAGGSPNEVLSAANLATCFGIQATWLCNEQGVALLAQRLAPS